MTREQAVKQMWKLSKAIEDQGFTISEIASHASIAIKRNPTLHLKSDESEFIFEKGNKIISIFPVDENLYPGRIETQIGRDMRKKGITDCWTVRICKRFKNIVGVDISILDEFTDNDIKLAVQFANEG